MCDITRGRARTICKDGLGGNSSIYLFNFIDDAFTVTAGEATGINPLITEVFEFGLVGDGNTLEQVTATDRNTGTTVNTQTLTTVFQKLTAEDNANFNLLTKGFTGAVVKDRAGNYHAVGIDDGIDFNITSATGGAKTDLNGYTAVGTSTTKDLAPLLDSATVTALLALVA